MKYIIGKDRNQFEMFCLEERIEKDNEVRMIELFVDSLTLAEYGFVEQKANPQGGRPAYHPSALLKLFIYGYMNRIRSSRQLEKECYRNLEVMWLMRELAPVWNVYLCCDKLHQPEMFIFELWQKNKKIILKL